MEFFNSTNGYHVFQAEDSSQAVEVVHRSILLSSYFSILFIKCL